MGVGYLDHIQFMDTISIIVWRSQESAGNKIESQIKIHPNKESRIVQNQILLLRINVSCAVPQKEVLN